MSITLLDLKDSTAHIEIVGMWNCGSWRATSPANKILCFDIIVEKLPTSRMQVLKKTYTQTKSFKEDKQSTKYKTKKINK